MKRRDWLRLSSLTGLALFSPKFIHSQKNKTATPLPDPDICNISTKDIQGPFFTPNAPTRHLIRPTNAKGSILYLTGTVYYNDCETPIPNAEIDVWQADHEGEYDNEGFNFRGQFKTDALGNFALDTTLPGKYLNGRQYRPRHIHFKFKGGGAKELTTQLYFEGDESIPIDPWASTPEAGDRIIPLSIDDSGRLHGVFDVKLNAKPTENLDALSGKHPNRILSIAPNPINSAGNLSISLKKASEVALLLFDLDGQFIKTIQKTKMGKGLHTIVLNKLSEQGLNLPPGLYVVQLKINNELKDSKRVIFV